MLLNADRVASSTAFTARRWASLPLSEPLVKLLLAWRGQSKFNKDTEGLFANKLGLGAINRLSTKWILRWLRRRA